MKKYLIFFIIILTNTFSNAQDKSRFLVNINGTVGYHSIVFKDFAKSSGVSFGYALNLGIYAIHKNKYKFGLYFGLLEAASLDENRRKLSENFVLPDNDFDKHIIFKFAQFRSGHIGWFSEYNVNEKLTLYDYIGFGIFGTTEKDQLLDFGMNKEIGVLIGDADKFRIRIGVHFDTTFGTGNPNYLQRNVGVSIGGSRII